MFFFALISDFSERAFNLLFSLERVKRVDEKILASPAKKRL